MVPIMRKMETENWNTIRNLRKGESLRFLRFFPRKTEIGLKEDRKMAGNIPAARPANKKMRTSPIKRRGSEKSSMMLFPANRLKVGRKSFMRASAAVRDIKVIKRVSPIN